MKSFLLILFFAAICCSENTQSEHHVIYHQQPETRSKIYGAIRAGNMTGMQNLMRDLPLNDAAFGKDANLLDDLLHVSIGLPKDENFNEEIVKYLLKQGADLESLDYKDRTPLYLAVQLGKKKAVELLLKLGANSNIYYQYGRDPNVTLLQTAFSSGNEKMIELLIERGANINQTDEKGRPLLHQAILEGYKKVVGMLIEKGANVNSVENESKMTPLHYVAKYDFLKRYSENWTDDDNLKLAELLINHGADLNAKDENNKTPFDLAETEKMKTFLRSKMDFVGWIKSWW